MGSEAPLAHDYPHYLDAPPEPKEMYPPYCCAVGGASDFFVRTSAAGSLKDLRNSRAVSDPITAHAD
jgi:hypothetical protein